MATETVVATIEIRRSFQRAMRENVAADVMAAIIKEVTTQKWTLELLHQDGTTKWFEEHGQYPTSVSVYFKLTGPAGPNADFELNDRLVQLSESAQGNQRTRREWKLYQVNGEKWEPLTIKEKIERANARGNTNTVSYAEVNMPTQEAIDYVFEEIYGCGPQLRMLMSRVREAIESGFSFRSHALLIGKPGAAKSFTLLNAAKLFPEPGAVMWIDGTAMTSAGIIDALKNAETMPRFIFVEEIDKADSGACSVLLGIMDKHGEVRKTTYRDKVDKECRSVVFATANSMERMQRIADGALISRFGGNPITYTRGQEEVLRRILNRELNDLNRAMCIKPVEKTDKDGKVSKVPCGACKECKRRNKWIDESIKFSKENQTVLMADTLDPRFVIDLCIGLSGDKNGTYLEDVLATSIKRETIAEYN